MLVTTTLGFISVATLEEHHAQTLKQMRLEILLRRRDMKRRSRGLLQPRALSSATRDKARSSAHVTPA